MRTQCWFSYDGPGRIGISRSVPRSIKPGYRRYAALNPGGYFKSASEAEYRVLYGEQLAQLDPTMVWTELHAMVAPHEPVLLCWEKAGQFCHRRLVADWFLDHLGKEVPEVN